MPPFYITTSHKLPHDHKYLGPYARYMLALLCFIGQGKYPAIVLCHKFTNEEKIAISGIKGDCVTIVSIHERRI